MPYVGKKPADIIATAVDTTTGTFSGEIDAASLDISGNIDVDGVTNLDVTDIDGTLNVAGETTLQTHLNMGDDDTIKLGAGVDLTLASNGTHGTIATPNGILTVDAASTLILDSDAGNIQLKDGGNNFMTLSQTSSTVASINIPTSDGDLHIVGNDGGVAVTALTFDMSAAGKAIFNAGLAIGGTGDANTLDDYEEGTWSPQIFSNTTQIGTSGVSGYYTKIGNVVHVNGGINRDDTASLSGSLIIKNLPFASANTSRNYSMTGGFWFDKASAADVVAFAWVDQNVTQILPKSIGTEYNNSVTYMTANNLEHGRPLYFSATYKTT